MLSIAVMMLYCCSGLALLAGARLYSSQATPPLQLLIGTVLGGFGALLHACLLYQVLFGRPSLALNTTDSASLVGLIVAVITLWTIRKRPRFASIGALLLWCCAIVAALTDDGSRKFLTSESGWLLTTHIVIAIVAYGLIAIGAAFAAALAALDRRLHSRRPLGIMSSLPSVEALEVAMFRSISIGFALLTLTLFSGFIFVNDLVAQHLAQKVGLSCVAWLILGILLIGHWRLGWRGRTAAHWVLGGFVLLLLAYFGSKVILEVLLDRHWG